jgi:hypothetical protein
MLTNIKRRVKKATDKPVVTIRDYIRAAQPMIGETYYTINSWDGKTDVAAVTVFRISDAGNIFYRTEGKEGHDYTYIMACVRTWYTTEQEALKAQLKRLKKSAKHYSDIAEKTRKRHDRLLRRYEKQKAG